MINVENKIPTVELSENKGSRNSKCDAKENESRAGIFAREGKRAICPPVLVGDVRYGIVYDDVANEWLADRYVVEGIAFFNGKWHCCDKDCEWFEVGSDLCISAEVAKRMLTRLFDCGEKVVDLTRCENVSSVEEDEG